MLRELRIKNVAIIDGLAVSFGSGLNVLTGETGAGKSILLRSLALLCGGRASSELLRSEAENATVEGVFDCQIGAELRATVGIDDEEDGDEIIIRRQVPRAGKGRIHVNGGVATLSMLRQLGENLVHIYGQNEQALLLRPKSHLDYLDQFGDQQTKREAMSAAYSALGQAQRQLEELDERSRRMAEKRELLEFQRSELDSAKLVEGEETQLRSDRERLRHAERIGRICGDGEADLYSSGDAIVTRLARLAGELEALADVVPDLSSPAELVEQGRVVLEEAALQLRTIASHSRADPTQLEEVEDRLSLLGRLAKKYAAPASELPAILARVEEELHAIDSHAQDRESAAEKVELCLAEAARCALSLSNDRQKVAKRLEKAMVKELADLGMEGSVFEVSQETSAMRAIEDFGPTGSDRVEFFLSANRGEAPQPLARVASGGELSRILLALKALTAQTADTPVLIFDEVDAGVGGTVAEAVARKLRLLAQTHQVVCITHLPQIAALADHHFAVEKSTRQGRTISDTRQLGEEDRVAEISRMLGAPASGEAARYARELIAQGKKPARRSTKSARSSGR